MTKPKPPHIPKRPSWDDDDESVTVYDPHPVHTQASSIRTQSPNAEAHEGDEKTSQVNVAGLMEALASQGTPPKQTLPLTPMGEQARRQGIRSEIQEHTASHIVLTTPIVESPSDVDSIELAAHQPAAPLVSEHPSSPQHTFDAQAFSPTPSFDEEGEEYQAISHADIVEELPTSLPYREESPTAPGLNGLSLSTDDLDEVTDAISVQSYRDRYEGHKPIAKGGMALVSKVFDRSLRRQNAMKILDAQLAKQDVNIKRFVQEARITGQLGHPNIVPVHDIGIGNAGQHYFTMKLVEGQTLREYIDEEGVDVSSEASLYAVLQIFSRVCDAVAYAHSRGVIHRDLKPSNIMVGSHGQVYVMDWGIAYILPHHGDDGCIQQDRQEIPAEIEGDIVGTWNYMAPEQAYGQTHNLGEHTDIFALGAILYEILTDTPPYHQGSMYVLLQKAQRTEFEHPQERAPHLLLPKGLCDIVMKAMQHDPTQRYASVTALQEDLELFLRRGSQPPSRRYQAGERIITEGDPGHEAYIIARGHCRVFKEIDGRQVTLREMGPGEVFGETSIFLSQTRTASVEAIDQVTLMVLAKDTLEQRLDHDIWLGRFVHTVTHRFVDVDQKATQLHQDLERATLINAVLQALHHHGQSTHRGRELSWSGLQHVLCEQFSCTEQDLLYRLQQTGMFQMLFEEDLLLYPI